VNGRVITVPERSSNAPPRGFTASDLLAAVATVRASEGWSLGLPQTSAFLDYRKVAAVVAAGTSIIHFGAATPVVAAVGGLFPTPSKSLAALKERIAPLSSLCDLLVMRQRGMWWNELHTIADRLDANDVWNTAQLVNSAGKRLRVFEGSLRGGIFSEKFGVPPVISSYYWFFDAGHQANVVERLGLSPGDHVATGPGALERKYLGYQTTSWWSNPHTDLDGFSQTRLILLRASKRPTGLVAFDV
jgi:hypothetical protein